MWRVKKDNKIKRETKREKKEEDFCLGDSTKREIITRFGFCLQMFCKAHK